MSARIEAVTKALKETGNDAYFAWSEIGLQYLVGLQEHPGHRFMTLGISKSGETCFICGALSETQARRKGLSNIRAWKDGEDPLTHFSALGEEWGLKGGLILVDEDMPALMLLAMQSTFPGARFQNGGPLLNGMRRVKTESELNLLRIAAKIADDAYDEVRPQIRNGLTERQVEKLLFNAMESRGGHPDFGIVASGPNGAEPHHATDDTVLKSGDIVILDFGCSVDGYRSDITRTVAIDHASDEARRVYEIVYRAHQAGREAVAAGKPLGNADGAARRVIEDAGYGPKFMHRLGHGLGLQGHEMPFLVPNESDPFQRGDCFSIEPGIYLPNQFGVRIENIYTCTGVGAESLNRMPASELEIVGN